MRFTLAEPPQPKGDKKSFPPASAYLYAEPLLRYWKIALIIALALCAYFLLDLNLTGGRAMQAGALSSSHANFGENCAKCHTPFGQVEDAKCSICHEKQSTIHNLRSTGFYSFQAHYVYRSDSLARAERTRTKHAEQPCRACHMEHRGRDTKLARVSNARCANCHFEDFAEDHPNFQFARTSAPDDSALKFTHIKHVREVRKGQGKRQRAWGRGQKSKFQNQKSEIESACYFCHEPEFDGKLFKPISFEQHCAACHLTNTLTPPLAIASKNEGEGVMTLTELRERNEVSTQWARAANPNEFRVLGETRIVKRVAHRDPWVLWHLEQGAGGKEQTTNNQLFNLQFTVAILRMTQDSALHAQLTRVDTVLRKLQNSKTPKLRHSINPPIQSAFHPLAEKIAKPCVECHTLSGAGVLPVNGEQEVLRRANFDHRAHIVQAQCLDCHFKIDVEKVAPDTLLSIRQDRSSVQNLPEIDKCWQCHAEEKATRDCARCHEFHP